MEAKTYIKDLKISPKKLRFILPEIKKLRPIDALAKLFYMPKKSARIFYKAIKSAIDSAKLTLKTSEDLLRFRLLTIEEGRRLKRFQPGGRGTVKPILKRYAHIKMILVAENKQSLIKKVKSGKNEEVEMKNLKVKTKSKTQKSRKKI